MNLMSISLATGQLKWQVPLGTPQSSRNWRGGINFGGPNMLAVGDVLYVATNNGALLAVNLASHQIKWAIQHDTKPLMENRRIFWRNGMMTAPTEPWHIAGRRRSSLSERRFGATALRDRSLGASRSMETANFGGRLGRRDRRTNRLSAWASSMALGSTNREIYSGAPSFRTKITRCGR